MTDHENTPYDILILGGGPIGTSTLYNLTKSSKAGRIGLVTNDLKDDPRTTFMNSGGCINWDWPDPLKKQMMTETKDFLFGLIDEGVDLLENKDSYFSLYDGSYVPSLNISAARLVEYFKKQSAEKGATIHEDTEITSVTNNGELYTIVTNKGELKAKIVLLALGVTNEKFMPGMELEKEKRQVFIIDTPVTDRELKVPHTIVETSDDQYAYLFVKHYADGWKFVVGQEDIVHDDNLEAPVDYWDTIMATNFSDVFSFVKNAAVEKISWGVDTQKKLLQLTTDDKGTLIAANCGSAVRSCVYLGRILSEKIIELLA